LSWERVSVRGSSWPTDVSTPSGPRIAVHVAARVQALAGPGEVLVSSTTSGLLEGSGMVLEDAGLHELKGLSGMRQVFRLVLPQTS
jgi:class 3 adenylate cyclase